jgi:hypothetical protein
MVAEKSLPYGGLQFGKECFGSKSYPDNEQVKDENCNMPCAYNKEMMCGAADHNSVYEFDYNSKKADKEPELEYIGCFKDLTDGTRDLEVELSYDASPADCAKMVAEKKLPYGGLQFGKECFGSKSYPDNEQVKDENCNMPCQYDPKMMCGAGGHNSVYKFNYGGNGQGKKDNKRVRG